MLIYSTYFLEKIKIAIKKSNKRLLYLILFCFISLKFVNKIIFFGNTNKII